MLQTKSPSVNGSQPAVEPAPARPPRYSSNYAAWGILFGVGSAIGYGLANAFLRQAASEPPIWVSAMKAACTAVIFVPWFAWLSLRGVSVLPPWRMCAGLILVSVLTQYFGNVYFQMSLHEIGLALAVPVNLGTMIFSGAILGRVWMREPLTPKICLGLSIIVISIAILSARYSAPVVEGSSARWFAGLFHAGTSGFIYAILGLVIRKSMSHQIPLATPIVFVTLTGTIGLVTLSYLWEGPAAIAAIPPLSWLVMILAGLSNAMAFLSLTQALRLLPAVYVNGINAANLLFSALIALFYFLEPWTARLGWGIVVMLVGLAVLAYGAHENRQRFRRKRVVAR